MSPYQNKKFVASQLFPVLKSINESTFAKNIFFQIILIRYGTPEVENRLYSVKSELCTKPRNKTSCFSLTFHTLFLFRFNCARICTIGTKHFGKQTRACRTKHNGKPICSCSTKHSGKQTRACRTKHNGKQIRSCSTKYSSKQTCAGGTKYNDEQTRAICTQYSGKQASYIITEKEIFKL